MTVKFLTQKQKRKYINISRDIAIKELLKEYDVNSEKELDEWGKREYDHIMRDNWEPDFGYDGAIGALDEFPDCCGATVMNNFGWRQKHKKTKLTFEEKAQVCLSINSLLKESENKIIVSILNAYQQVLLKPIFEKFGGEQFGRPTKGRHGYNLYPWIFIKGTPKKTKRAFG